MRERLSVQSRPNNHDIILRSHLGEGLLVWRPGEEQKVKLFKVRSHHSSWQRPDEQLACVCSHILEGMRYPTRNKERGPLRDAHSAVCHFDQEGSFHNP